ncbi:MAG: reverse transcriptase family protein, partial [Candidatus Humimicrobiaceae bacterium]
NLDDLSSYLGLEQNILDYIINNIKDYYSINSIPKGNNEKRIIYCPHSSLKKIQKLLLKIIFKKITLPNSMIGAMKGGSPKKNASFHTGSQVILNIDIKNFFPSINKNDVLEVFKSLGFNHEISNILTTLTTYDEILPQGVPTSNYIAYLNIRKLDYRLSKLCEKNKFKITFYVDDITISGGKRLSSFKNLIFKIINKEGFAINMNKFLDNGISNKFKRQAINKIVVNSGKLNVTKDYYNKIRAIIFNCIKYGVDSQNVSKDSLLGKIGYVKSINPEKGQKLLSDFYKIIW